jgi:hypothetical protein
LSLNLGKHSTFLDKEQSTLTFSKSGNKDRWILKKEGDKWVYLTDISLSAKQQILEDLGKKSLSEQFEQSGYTSKQKHKGR